jgi:hypothetical protein
MSDLKLFADTNRPITSQRADGAAELRHDHFMAKVPKVLGEMAPKFSGIIDQAMPNGGARQQRIYNFPKRGVLVDKVRDPRFGLVGAYHESILEAVLEEFMA